MGLHNKFPSYFYRRGNLFNTYLSHADPTDVEPRRERPAKSQSRGRRSSETKTLAEDLTSYTLPSRPRSFGNIDRRLAEFARANLSAKEGAYLATAMAAQEGLQMAPDPSSAWRNLAACLEWVSTERKERYLAELIRRKETGVPLLRRERIERYVAEPESF